MRSTAVLTRAGTLCTARLRRAGNRLSRATRGVDARRGAQRYRLSGVVSTRRGVLGT